MDLYGKNIACMKKYRELFYERMEKKLEKAEWSYPCEEIRVQEARDGNKIFIVKRNGQKVRLNSPYRPKEEAERWAAQFAGENILVNAMLFGLGNGFFAEALLSRLQGDAKLFLYEPSAEIFQTALREMDLEQILSDQRVILCIGDINPDDFYNLLRENTHWTNLETQIVSHHTGYEVLFMEAYKDFLTYIKKTSQAVQINKDTRAFFSKKAVDNAIQNLAYVKESSIITDYVGHVPVDVPAIIVAAGPSLDKNIEELKRAKGKAFILAVDTAMRHLIKHDIMPDAMITLDAGKPFDYMNNPAIVDIPMFCMLEASHQILAFHQGKKIWFQGGTFLEDLFRRHGKEFVEYRPGGSVATAAFAVCAALEFRKIILVGQDLAYQGDVTHAGGEVSRVLNEERGIKMIEGIDGSQVKSRHDWIIYLDWFEEAIQIVKKEIEVIDATEGGALIHGSTLMTLSDVIDKYCQEEVDFRRILLDQPPVFTEEQYDEVKEEVAGYIRELDEMDLIAKDAANACRKAVDMIQEGKRNNSFYKLQQKALSATSQISEHLIYNLVDIYMSKQTDKYLSGIFVVSEDSQKDELAIYQNAEKIYSSIRDAIHELKPKLEAVIGDL